MTMKYVKRALLVGVALCGQCSFGAAVINMDSLLEGLITEAAESSPEGGKVNEAKVRRKAVSMVGGTLLYLISAESMDQQGDNRYEMLYSKDGKTWVVEVREANPDDISRVSQRVEVLNRASHAEAVSERQNN